MGKFSPFEKSSKEFHDSSASALRLKPDLKNENEEISVTSKSGIEFCDTTVRASRLSY